MLRALDLMAHSKLRVSEAIGLRRDDVNLSEAMLWVRRLKGSLSVNQLIEGDELRAIKRYIASAPTICPGSSSRSATPN